LPQKEISKKVSSKPIGTKRAVEIKKKEPKTYAFDFSPMDNRTKIAFFMPLPDGERIAIKVMTPLINDGTIVEIPPDAPENNLLIVGVGMTGVVPLTLVKLPKEILENKKELREVLEVALGKSMLNFGTFEIANQILFSQTYGRSLPLVESNLMLAIVRKRGNDLYIDAMGNIDFTSLNVKFGIQKDISENRQQFCKELTRKIVDVLKEIIVKAVRESKKLVKEDVEGDVRKKRRRRTKSIEDEYKVEEYEIT